MDEKRLERVRSFIEERGWKYSYSEEDGCGSIDFEYRGLAYHIWEFDDGKVTHMEISKKIFVLPRENGNLRSCFHPRGRESSDCDYQPRIYGKLQNDGIVAFFIGTLAICQKGVVF